MSNIAFLPSVAFVRNARPGIVLPTVGLPVAIGCQQTRVVHSSESG
jgi:hypothetical protein